MADGLDIRRGDSEGGSGKSDLHDEVAHMEGAEDHEPVCKVGLGDAFMVVL